MTPRVPISPLTDAQLRATPVPVTFTGAAPSGGSSTGGSTELTLASIAAKLGALGQKTMAGSAPVVLASDQGPVAVTLATDADTVGSGTIVALNGTVAVALNGKSAMRVEITGTWIGTLQFEGLVGTVWVPINGVMAGSTIIPQTTTVNGTFSPTPSGFAQFRVNATAWTSGTATISIRASAGTGGVYLNQSLPAFAVIPAFKIDQTTPGTTNLVSIAPPTLTKGTSSATGVSTQNLKDAGRTSIAMTAEFAFAQVAETLLTMTLSANGGATTTFSSRTITSSKKFRVQSAVLQIELLGSGTTPQRAYLRMRVNTAGATVATSPLQWILPCGVTTAIVKSSNWSAIDFPDCFELNGDGTATFGFTLETPDWVVTTATGRAKITIIGVEF